MPFELLFREVRLIETGGADGPWNMAVDEALLNTVENPTQPPAIRLYHFAPPTLSIGRFQKRSDVWEDLALKKKGIEFVRRPSGGHAVLHSDELTYCVVVNPSHLNPFSKRSVYRFVAWILLSCLEEFGVDSAQIEQHKHGEQDHPDCFASSSEYEVSNREHKKLIGSAQMISRRAILQHGSIPLGDGNRDIVKFLFSRNDSGLSPTSLSREARRPVSFPEVSSAFARTVKKILPGRTDNLTPEETTLVSKLNSKKYSTPAWNRKY